MTTTLEPRWEQPVMIKPTTNIMRQTKIVVVLVLVLVNRNPPPTLIFENDEDEDDWSTFIARVGETDTIRDTTNKTRPIRSSARFPGWQSEAFAIRPRQISRRKSVRAGRCSILPCSTGSSRIEHRPA